MSIQSKSCQTLVGIWYDSYLILKDGSNVKLYWWWNLNRDSYHDKKVALQVVGNLVQEVVELPDDFIL